MVRSRRLIALIAVTVLLLGTIPALAAPPPEPVCDGCGAAYTGAANATGVDVDVVESAAVVQLHENGSATWLVGLALSGPDADRVRTNDALHRRIASNATGERFAGIGRGALTHVTGDPADVGGEERAVYYRFHDDDFAQAGIGGTHVSTRFRGDLAVANYDGLGVDRLTVEGLGMSLTQAPPSATTVDGLSGSAFTVTQVDETVVTFHPQQASNPLELLWLQLLGVLSVAELLLPVVVGNVGIMLLPALVPHTLVLGVVLAVLGRFAPPDPTETARTAVVALFGVAAGVGLLQPLYADVFALPGLGGPSAVPVGLGVGAAAVAVGLTRPQRAEKLLFVWRAPAALSVAETLAVTATLLAGAGGAVAGLALPATTAWDGLGLALMVAAPTLAFLPATTAALDSRLRRGIAAIIVGFLVGGFAAPVLYSQPVGVVFPGVFLAPVVTGTLLALGWPSFLAGWLLAGLDGATASPGRS